MSDIKLFQLRNNQVKELFGKSVTVEKSLQNLIEKHLETFLGVTILGSEYSTGKKHKGRIDTLGIDENNCPVIIEYKRSTNENIINQGLFYLDWLLDHKAEFKMLVLDKLGKANANKIEWNGARLIGIAGDYTNYDIYAVEQINRNIELVRYKKYDEFLLLELINSTSEKWGNDKDTPVEIKYKTVRELLNKSSQQIKDLFEELRVYLEGLGQDVQMKELLYYFAFKTISNFACIEIHPKTNEVVIFLKIDPDSIKLEKGFTRDVRNIGHLGTGGLEVKVKNREDLEKAKPLIHKSYELG